MAFDGSNVVMKVDVFGVGKIFITYVENNKRRIKSDLFDKIVPINYYIISSKNKIILLMSPIPNYRIITIIY